MFEIIEARSPAGIGIRRRALSAEARQLLYGFLIVLGVTTTGMLLTLQGWKSRTPAFDMLTYFKSAEKLLETGTPARFGDISSYGSFSPPGTTWLLAPGMLVLNDPRLYEDVGSALLYAGTLLGVFLLARAVFGFRSAYVSVVLYGISGLGLAFAGSLWPIGHPFFFVWMIYFAIGWVTHRDAKYLAGSILIWTLGLYHDMAIMPALLVLVVMSLLYRPPLFTRFHVPVAALTLIVWAPFLQFETERGFSDIWSLIFRQQIMPSNYKEAWCDPSLNISALSSPSLPAYEGSASNFFDRMINRASRILDGLLANFNEVTRSAALSVLFLLWALASLLMSVIRQGRPRLLVISLAAPWLILLLVAEPGRPERFIWLWPLQAIALCAFLAPVSARWRVPAPALWLGALVLLGTLLVPSLESHLEPGLREGWAGIDSEEIQVVEYLANQLHSEGKQQAAIGYQILIYEFMPQYATLDRQYKVGAEFDFWLEHRGITNSDQCAEGIAPGDEYRIVQTRPLGDESWPRHYFNTQLDPSFRLRRQFDAYAVYKRD